METALRRRLESLQNQLGELLEDSDDADLQSAPLTYRVTELYLVLREYAPEASMPRRAARRQWKALRKRLLPAYESLAAGLRAEDVAIPSIRPTNISRISLHITSMFFVLTLLWLPIPGWGLMIFAGLVAATAWFLETGRRRSEALNAKLMHFFRRVAHPVEAHKINSSTWYATALLALSLLDSPLIGGMAVATLGLGDPIAGLVGRRWGKVRLMNERTLEGTCAFAVAAFLACWVYLVLCFPEVETPRAILLASVAAVSGAATELLSRRVDDNFAIPIGVVLGVGPVVLLLG